MLRERERTRPGLGIIEPCLPSPAKVPPSGPGWIHEIKHDGMRIMARHDGAGVRVITRHGNDFTSRFPFVVAAVSALRARSFLIDGEAIVTNGDGLAVFDLIRHTRHGDAAVLCAFDLIELDGEDLRRSSIEYRKRKLAKLVRGPHFGIVLNEHYKGDGEIIFKHACKLGCEGIVSKRLGSFYRFGRSPHWIKVKSPKAPAVTRARPKRIGAVRPNMANITLLKFDKDGKLVGEPPQPGPEVTDLVLIAHGWTEAEDSAREHYRELVDSLEGILSENRAQWKGRSVAYFGVIWPAAKYADDLTVIPDVGDRARAAMAASLNDDDLKAHAQNVAQFLGIDPELLAAQALQAPDDESARDTLVSTLQRSIPDRRRALADKQTRAEHDIAFENTGSNLFSTIENELHHLKNDADVVADNPLKRSLKLLRSDPKTIIAQILNLFTYNEMKIRSGKVGEGLAKVLDPLLANGKRVHLVGHSFGGRLMTSAAAAVQGKISNLTVLEGAFSHNALSSDGENDGAYRSVIDNAKVTGRIAAAHSDQDWAVWIAYPLASWHFHDSYKARLGGPLIQLFGGPNDRYGAMGANGPQHLHDVNQSRFDGTSLPGLNPGVHALDCTSFVAGHSQVWNKGSAYIVAAGLLAA